MSKKYILIDEGEHSLYNPNKKLYRLKAIRDFGDVKKGDFGGLIEEEENLSHDGNCWIYDDSKVYDKAKVYGNAKVSNSSIVYGHTEIYGNAEVTRMSRVCDAAKIYDNATISGFCDICGCAEVYENAEIRDLSIIRRNVKIHGNAKISGDLKDFVNSYIAGDVDIAGNAYITKNADIVSNFNVMTTTWKEKVEIYDSNGSKTTDNIEVDITAFRNTDGSFTINCSDYLRTLDDILFMIYNREREK